MIDPNRPARQTPGLMGDHRRGARHASVALVVLVGAFAVGGCGGDGGAKPAEPTTTVPAGLEVTEGAEVEVKAADNRFLPPEIKVRAGTDVRFVNVGRNVHNVLPANMGDYVVRKEEFEPGDEATVTFAEPGTYHYFCSIHGTSKVGMTGTVYVVGD